MFFHFKIQINNKRISLKSEMSIPTQKLELKRKFEIFSNNEFEEEITEHNEKKAKKKENEEKNIKYFSISTDPQVQYASLGLHQSSINKYEPTSPNMHGLDKVTHPIVNRTQIESPFNKMKRAQLNFQTATKLFSKTVDTKISQQNAINNTDKEETKTFIRIFRGNWNMKTALSNPKVLFLFGDNFIKKGTKGQAVIRYAPNSAGIPTKKFPSMNSESFLNDSEFEENKRKIEEAFRIIEIRVGKELITEANNSNSTKCYSSFEGIMFPENGFGTGLAMLKAKAPLTAQW